MYMLALLLTILIAAVSSLRCPTNWMLYETDCYNYSSVTKTFWDASEYCQEQPLITNDGVNHTAELVSIHSKTENAFVYSFAPSVTFFIGMYRQNNVWKWVDGTSVDYKGWAPGQPDSNSQDKGVMWNTKPSLWDNQLDRLLNFVCKVPAANCLQMVGEVFCSADVDCKNGGTCNTDGSCTCPTGFSCIDCSLYDGCQSNPCMSGGTCINNEDAMAYSCVCPTGYSGEKCEISTDACSSSPCKNSGTCLATTVDPFYVCSCAWPWTDTTCDHYDGCLSNPCLNDGTCNDDNEPFVCECPDGYSGTFCQINDVTVPCNSPTPDPAVVVVKSSNLEDACESGPCGNGTCYSITDPPHYICQCQPPYYGSQCDVYDGCLSHPCMNGGICINNEEGEVFDCQCPDEYTGTMCNLQRYTGDVSDVENKFVVAYVLVPIILIIILIVVLLAIFIMYRRRRRTEEETKSRPI